MGKAILVVVALLGLASGAPAQFTQKITCVSSQLVTEETGATAQRSRPPLFPSPLGNDRPRVNVQTTKKTTAHLIFETDKLRYEVEGGRQHFLNPGDYWAKVTPGYLEVMISKNGDNTYVSYTYHILSVTAIPEKKQ